MSHDVDRLCREARQVLDTGHPDRAKLAIGLYRQALEQAPDASVEPYLGLAYFAYKAGLKDQARVLLEAARQVSPFSQPIQRLLRQLNEPVKEPELTQVVEFRFPDLI